MFGLVEVAQLRDLEVGVAQVVRSGALVGAGVDAPVQVGGLLVGGDAVRQSLFALDVPERLQADGEAADVVPVDVGVAIRVGGDGIGGAFSVPGDAGGLQPLGGGPVARLAGQPDLVLGEQAPVVFAAR